MNEKQSLISKLQSIVDQANQTSSPKLFFTLLYEFAKLLLFGPQFKEALKIIFDKGKKVNEALKAQAKEALEELKRNMQRISQYVKNNNVTNQSVIQYLDTFQDRLKKLDLLELAPLLFPLEEALWELLNDESTDHGNFIKTFGKINRINDYKFIRTADAFPKFKAWEQESFYFIQIRQTADWHSMNHIVAFLERYDLKIYDTIIDELTETGMDATKLKEEHSALIKYAYFEKAPSSNLFPTTEEYKHHMRRVLEAIKAMASTNTPTEVKTHIYTYNYPTGELMIDNDEPIMYQTHENPAKLLNTMKQRKWKPLTFTSAHNNLGLYDRCKAKELSTKETRQIEGILRQINDQIERTGKPKFLIFQKDKNSLKEKVIRKSSQYKQL